MAQTKRQVVDYVQEKVTYERLTLKPLKFTKLGENRYVASALGDDYETQMIDNRLWLCVYRCGNSVHQQPCKNLTSAIKAANKYFRKHIISWFEK